MLKMYMLLMPSEQVLFNKYTVQMPPISYGVLSGGLKERNIQLDLYDLNKKYKEAHDLENTKNLLSHIYNKDMIIGYLSGESHLEIDKIVDWLLPNDIDEYDYIGCSIGADFSFSQIHLGLILAYALKKKYGKKIILGGNNVSYLYIYKDFYKELWKCIIREFKYVIKGPGEKVISNVIDHIRYGEEHTSLSDIKGLVYEEQGEIMFNQEEEPIIIRPDWGSLDMSFYNRNLSKDKTIRMNTLYKWPNWVNRWIECYHSIKSNKKVSQLVLPYIFNFNCIYNCAFCTQSDTTRGEVIGADVNQIVNDLEYLSYTYNTPHFYFLNNSFNYKLGIVEEVCEEIIKRNLKIYWSDCARVNNLTYDRIKLMKEAGCQKLIFGFESGSNKILKLINKKLNLELLEKVLKWCHELGVLAELEVIIGLPQETEEEFIKTYNFIKKNNKYINYFWTNEYFLVPNSLIGEYPKDYNIEIRYDTYNYDDLLKQNKEMFMNNQWDFPHNARLYTFDEIDGRKYEEISKHNKSKIRRLMHLYDKEFHQVENFYKKLLSI